jgi:transcriptional regulator with XRE-family HTH domain
MDSEIISKNILNLRKSLKLTQAEFAKKLHITYQAVSKWENGQSIPDITTLNYICKTFNVDLNELINGPQKKKIINKPLIIVFVIIWLIIIGILLYIILNHHQSFEFKTISSNCSAFNITGSAAYNNNKTSIYISNIDYCGGDDNILYSKIECNLYNNDSLITSCNLDKSNITLADYLKEVRINVDDKSCPDLTTSSLYLYINATDKNNKTINYQIPLSLNSNCN